MKQIITTCAFIAILFSNNSFSQTTVILQPGAAEGKDATIWTLEPTINYGDFSDFIAAAWTWSGDEGTYRSLLEFNLDTIPQGSTITCANLSLYYNNLSGTNGQEGENESVLQRITSPWSENVVTWNTMPTTTAVNQIILPTSTFISEDYLDIDVSAMVSDMIEDPVNSYGFMIFLSAEEKYSSMKFCSSDYTGGGLKFPRLEICYEAPVDISSVEKEVLSITPNPFHDNFVINFDKALSEETICYLRNVNGQIVATGLMTPGTTNFNFQIDAGLDGGIYILQMVGNNSVSYARVVKE